MSDKILGQAGTSLADVYDVEGSVAGVARLDSEEVKTVHELGSTIFSERYGQRLIQLSSTAVLQDVNWDLNLTLGRNVERILHYAVLATAARVSKAQLSLSDLSSAGVISTDCPFWTWSVGAGGDIDKPIRVMLNGSIVDIRTLISGESPTGPTMSAGSDQRSQVPLLTFRGRSTSFGAGTVTVTALIVMGFVQTQGLSSKGLPFPGW